MRKIFDSTSLAYPKADIPGVQIALPRNQSPTFHLRLAQVLAPRRENGVLIIGSGENVHNLHGLRPEGSAPPAWVLGFENWLENALSANDFERLLSFPRQPESTLLAHLTPDHLMPPFVCLGAGQKDFALMRLHRSFSHGSVGMTCYGFGSRDDEPKR